MCSIGIQSIFHGSQPQLHLAFAHLNGVFTPLHYPARAKEQMYKE